MPYSAFALTASTSAVVSNRRPAGRITRSWQPSFKRCEVFKISATTSSNHARSGVLSLPHGAVPTPAFMPVGTQGTVKTVGSEDLELLGFEMLLANTYHLALRPGADVVERMGGLNQFMSWKKPILTDSGGFQVMSLGAIRKIDYDGVTFKSHLDGSLLRLTPEESIRIQRQLGVDISMALDVCP